MTLASGTDLFMFDPLQANPQASNSMTINQINTTTNMWALEVTATQAASSTDILAVFRGQMPNTYGGEAVDVDIWHSNSTTSNNCLFSAELERDQATADMSADNFTTLTDGSATAVPGTANQIQKYTISSVTLPSSFTGGDVFRLRIKRRLSQAGDTNAGQTLIAWVRIGVH
jgi:hypothetical protein